MNEIVRASSIQPIINLVTDAVTSQHTKRAYGRALADFLAWHQQTGQTGLSKAIVQAHVSALRESGTTASSIKQRLTAIRKLALEAADNGLIDHATAEAITRVQGISSAGKRLGNWLSMQQAQALLDAPDTSTTKGTRDKAILAVLLGCGLRRQEIASLKFSHIQQREGRWVIVDLVGKRNKTRSVPMPSWAKAALDRWAQCLEAPEGYIFRGIRRGGHVQASGLTAQAVFVVVSEYAKDIGVTVHPHDLRRTFAKLAYKGGSPVDQVQLSLGHSSLQTTELYLGITQNLTDDPCDYIKLR